MLEDQPTGKGPGRRCEIGCQTWPDSDDFDICLICDGETTKMSDVTPMDPDEAYSLRNRVLFEKFYEKWDAMKDPARLQPS